MFALVTLAVTVPLLRNNVLCIDVHASSTMPESGAMEFVRNRQLSGRMVTFFDWGQYAIWHKSGDLLVSMDGRRETVYSERIVDLHLDMYLGMENGLAYLDSLHADYVWIPNELPLVSNLMTSPMWTPAYRGGRSIIFARSSLRPGGVPESQRSGRDRKASPTLAVPALRPVRGPSPRSAGPAEPIWRRRPNLSGRARRVCR